MSLEDLLAKNTAAVERNSELLEKLVARAEAAGAVSSAGSSTAAADTKGKGKGKGKSDAADSNENTDAGSDAPTFTHDEVKSMAAAWLGEFKANEADPETDARRAAIKAALAKVAGKENAAVTDVPASELHRVVAWLNKKKETDAGHGKGRLTAVPAAGSAASGGDDDI